MDIQKLNYGYPKFCSIFGYIDFWISKNELWISKNRINDILNSVWVLDIQKCILGYPKKHWFFDTQKSNYGYLKFSMTFGYPKMHIYVFLDIQKWIMDIQKSICGYPKIHFWISKIFPSFRWFKKGLLLAKEWALSTGKLPSRLAQEQCG